jgi:hypothetical protein
MTVPKSLLLLVVLAIASTGCGGDAAGTTTTLGTTTSLGTTTTSETTAASEPATTLETTTTADPDEAIEADLTADIESLAIALDERDLETYLELLQPSLPDSERDRAIYFFVAAPVHVLLDQCEIVTVSGFISEAVCPVEITDPVRLEFGPAEGQLDLVRYGDGLSPIGDGTLDVSQYTNSSLASGAYLEQYLPDEYAAACDPSGYDREIRYEYGVTLTSECGELVAANAEDVAQWVRDGRPAP